MAEPLEFLEAVPQGEGHFAGTTRKGDLVEAFFVNLGQAPTGKRVASSGPGGRRARHALDRDDLIFILESKKRDWQKTRASASDRGNVLRIGDQLVRSGLTASSVARNLGLSPRTYSKWKHGAGIS